MKDQFGVEHKTYKDYIQDAWNRKETDHEYFKVLFPKKRDDSWENWEMKRLYHDESD